MVAGQRRWGKMAAVYYVVTMLQMASSSLFVSAAQGLVLSERIMFLSKTAADLSALAYKDNPPGNGYDFFVSLMADGPEQVLVAGKSGYCFAAFRGTTLSWDDWQQ